MAYHVIACHLRLSRLVLRMSFLLQYGVLTGSNVRNILRRATITTIHTYGVPGLRIIGCLQNKLIFICLGLVELSLTVQLDLPRLGLNRIKY
jgi:hypothetical protein